jgi:hypothetical protein
MTAKVNAVTPVGPHFQIDDVLVVAAELSAAKSLGLDVRWTLVADEEILTKLSVSLDLAQQNQSAPIASTRALLRASSARRNGRALTRDAQENAMPKAVNGIPLDVSAARRGTALNVLLGTGLRKGSEAWQQSSRDDTCFQTVAMLPSDCTLRCEMFNAKAVQTSVEQLRSPQGLTRDWAGAIPGFKWRFTLAPDAPNLTPTLARHLQGFVATPTATVAVGATMAHPDTPGAVGLVAPLMTSFPGVVLDGGNRRELPKTSGVTPQVVRNRLRTLQGVEEVQEAGIAIATAMYPRADYSKFLFDTYQSIRDQHVPGEPKIPWYVQVDGPMDAESTMLLNVVSIMAKTEGAVDLKIAHNRQRSGIANTNNAALDRVEEEKVLFLDADDVLMPGILRTIEKVFVSNSKIGWVATGFQPFDSEVPGDQTAISRATSDGLERYRSLRNGDQKLPRIVPIARGGLTNMRTSGQPDDVSKKISESKNYRKEHTLCVKTDLARRPGGFGSIEREGDFALLYALSEQGAGALLLEPGRLYRRWGGQTTSNSNQVGLYPLDRLAEIASSVRRLDAIRSMPDW